MHTFIGDWKHCNYSNCIQLGGEGGTDLVPGSRNLRNDKSYVFYLCLVFPRYLLIEVYNKNKNDNENVHIYYWERYVNYIILCFSCCLLSANWYVKSRWSGYRKIIDTEEIRGESILPWYQIPIIYEETRT